MNKFLAHFITITKHRNKVIFYCFRAGIGFQGLFHDLSKYSPVEFLEGVKYFEGDRSPNEKARETYGFSKAWIHHKGRNKHHFEYWTDYSLETGKVEPVKMPYNYVIEMFCDRLAASKIYADKDYKDDFPLLYYNRKKDNKRIHPDSAMLIEYLLNMLATQGEKETFSYIRQLNKDNGYTLA